MAPAASDMRRKLIHVAKVRAGQTATCITTWEIHVYPPFISPLNPRFTSSKVPADHKWINTGTEELLFLVFFIFKALKHWEISYEDRELQPGRASSAPISIKQLQQTFASHVITRDSNGSVYAQDTLATTLLRTELNSQMHSKDFKVVHAPDKKGNIRSCSSSSSTQAKYKSPTSLCSSLKMDKISPRGLIKHCSLSLFHFISLNLNLLSFKR